MDASWDADAHVMRAIAAGDERAFASLHARLHPKLVRLATSVTGDREDARDVVQTSFVKLWRQAPAWQPRATLDTWMWKVTLRECLSVRRRLARTLQDALAIDRATAETPSADDVASTREAKARLRALLGDLSPRDRAIVALHLDEERAPHEIAGLLEMKPDACRQALSRALARVRARMTEPSTEAAHVAH